MIATPQCPSCNSEMFGIERGLNNPHYVCRNLRCFLYAIIFPSYEVKKLSLGIQVLRSEAIATHNRELMLEILKVADELENSPPMALRIVRMAKKLRVLAGVAP